MMQLIDVFLFFLILVEKKSIERGEEPSDA
jgi:hypothetical protein